jgi:hypothetical protein
MTALPTKPDDMARQTEQAKLERFMGKLLVATHQALRLGITLLRF